MVSFMVVELQPVFESFSLVVFTDFLDTKCNKLSLEISLWRRRLMLYCIKKNKNQADIHSKRQCDQ